MINEDNGTPIKHPLSNNNKVTCFRINPEGNPEVWNPWFDRWQEQNILPDDAEDRMVSFEDTWAEPFESFDFSLIDKNLNLK